ncbi:CHAP domain-containing protein [Salinicoccus roseus]|jgi:hypothetical protein|uniref:Peptidase C51 domain-containing protein n=1 Tax=Salinicoccus roseus TaxID=45670 RepID=A0A265E4C0_9STAP|nr:CHAP domain-containing protein [Salinicoccus roseus]OZT76432.1 hypothetical protein CFN03_11220 [Salinicoccus roseus]
MFHVKKGLTALIFIGLAAAGLYWADGQTEDGLWETLEYHLLPDPMANNTYDDGECTYHVFEKVKAQGDMIETSWRDADQWAENAEAGGYTVNGEPKTGAILQTERGELGHVAYIESINEDGSINISEMNYTEPYEVTERTIAADNIDRYSYIHPKENPRPKDLEEQA